MKRTLLYSLLGISLIALVSWGPEGHSTTAAIADRHLTPTAKAAVAAILHNQSMASVSSWADDIRPSQPQTGDWHFLNLELGLSYSRFVQATKSQATPNIYSEILLLERELGQPSTPRPRKVRDLKFLVHFIGDAHQPMHVSRKKDRGGNLDTVKYDNRTTNLHKVWDSLLLNDDLTNYMQLAAKVDHATPQQIQKWQSDDLLMWLYESYQASSEIYKEAPNHSVLPASYYSTHIAIAENRLERGGIRLAGVLNKIFR